MSSVKTFLSLAAIIALSPVDAYAGFDFVYGGKGSGEYNLPTYQVETTTEPGVSIRKAQRPESDPDDPALQVFSERYVPDTVKKKYNLSDDWFAKGGKAASTSTPTPLYPSPFAVPSAPAPLALPPEAEIAPAAAPAAPKIVESWRARKGENVRQILKRWSDREQTDLLWAAATSPELKKDFSFIGTYQDAVSALLKEGGIEGIHSQYRSNGMDPVMMSPASRVTTDVPAVPVGDVEAADAKDAPLLPLPDIVKERQERQQETRWYALAGASLQEVLKAWADDEGASVVWQAGTNFALKDSISQVGEFEDAVYRALSQYDNDSSRPVGQMYRNPNTGEKILVVNVDQSS
jgi:hypothetical protein